MKSIRWVQLAIMALILGSMITGCQKRKGYKTKSGLIFYVYGQHEQDSVLPTGSYLKLNVKKYVNDSLVKNTYSGFPQYEQVMPGAFYPYEAAEIYPFFHKGDSIVLIQDADSLLRRSLFMSVPRYIKSGDKIVTHFKVLDVFSSDSLVRLDQEKAYPAAIAHNRKTGGSRLGKWLKQKGIIAELTPDTIYIEMLEEGSGPEIEPNDVVSIRFTAKTLSGMILGSNRDTAQAPAQYQLMTGYMPVGVDEGIARLSVGDQARLFIPAMKSFGAAPPPGMEEGFQDMIFEVDILDKSNPQNPSASTAPSE